MKIYGLSDKGIVRGNNQDAYGFNVSGGIGIIAVCDGMGGAAAGNRASAIAVKQLMDGLTSEVLPASSVADIKSTMRGVIRTANTCVHNASEENEEYAGMGTTAVAAVISKKHGRALFANVGDSRAYLIHDGEIKQVTDDHSLVYEMVSRGQITKDEARKHPNRNIITKALGTDKEIHPDTFDVELSMGDLILLCTDGLCAMISDEEILEIIIKNEDNIESAVAELINRANIAGGSDNITAVLCLFCAGNEEAV